MQELPTPAELLSYFLKSLFCPSPMQELRTPAEPLSYFQKYLLFLLDDRMDREGCIASCPSSPDKTITADATIQLWQCPLCPLGLWACGAYICR